MQDHGAKRPFNILIDDLPETITVDGRSFLIDTDFRTVIEFELTMLNPKIADEEKGNRIVDLFFMDEIPVNIDRAAEELQTFYSCGNKPEKQKQRRRRKAHGESEKTEDEKDPPPPPEKRVYDFQVDAPLIFAAFLSQYGIDLHDIDYLHWWKFMAMFQGLNEDNEIVKIIGYRSTNLSKIKDKETRAHYAELQRKYALPNAMTDEQKIAAAGNAFAGGMRSAK